MPSDRQILGPEDEILARNLFSLALKLDGEQFDALLAGLRWATAHSCTEMEIRLAIMGFVKRAGARDYPDAYARVPAKLRLKLVDFDFSLSGSVSQVASLGVRSTKFKFEFCRPDP